MQKEIIVITKDKCPQCTFTKQFLTAKGIPHEIKNIENDRVLTDFVKSLGYYSLPVVLIYDGDKLTQHWSGFHPDKLENLK